MSQWMRMLGALRFAVVPVTAFGLVLLIADTRWLGSTGLSAAIRTRLAHQFLLAEAALVVLWAPLVGVFTAMRMGPRLGGSVVARMTLMTAASAAIVLAMQTAMESRPLVWSHAILWAAALALAMLGAACASMFREPLDAGAAAVGVALLGTIALFAAGPALDLLPGSVLDAALAVNPIVTTAAAADLDLWRMPLLYQLSPLAHRQVEYPAGGTALTAYLLIAGALLFLAVRQFTIKADNISIERISS
jgi:hypothetical protein